MNVVVTTFTRPKYLQQLLYTHGEPDARGSGTGSSHPPLLSCHLSGNPFTARDHRLISTISEG
jgi:hypothetical protein